MIGIPLTQFLVLFCNREYLHSTNDNPKRHYRVLHRFGSLYKEFTESCWWVRPVEGIQRLALTGGVMLFGESAVTRMLAGILVCVLWLVLLVFFHPYRARWDNILAALITCELLLTLVVGMALKLYKESSDFQSSTKDQFESVTFSTLIVSTNVTIVIIGFCSIWISCPCTAQIKNKIKNKVRQWKRKSRPWWGQVYNAVVCCLQSRVCCRCGKPLNALIFNTAMG
jgi:hypothetical protein